MMPPSDNWETQGAGTDGDAAAERMRSNGACPGDPSEPSPTTNVTFPTSIVASRFCASAERDGRRSIVTSSRQRRARIAVWYPEPVPISRTFSVPESRSAAVISATMYGWEIVCPSPMERGSSAYARCRLSFGTKRCRGTSSITESTRSSRIPRRRICSSTMRRRRTVPLTRSISARPGGPRSSSGPGGSE